MLLIIGISYKNVNLPNFISSHGYMNYKSTLTLTLFFVDIGLLSLDNYRFGSKKKKKRKCINKKMNQ